MAEHTVTLDGPLLPLAFVGCWNRKLIGSVSPRDAVAARIRTAVESEGVRTVILGGDNEYPSSTLDIDRNEVKGKKPKAEGANMNSYRADFKQGAALYTGIPRLFVAVGNHNIDDATGDIFKHQIDAFGSSLRSNYYKIEGTDINAVIIDTNLVDPRRSDRLMEMTEWLAHTVRSDPKPYFLIQHEPFAAFSKLSEEGIKKKSVLLNCVSILEAIKEHKPIAILCADTHNYQEGEIEYEGVHIPQYVVGTGGAMPDKMYELNAGEEVFKRGDMPFTYTFKEKKANYGYLRIDPGPTFTFIEAAPWRGGVRRTRRRAKQRRTKSRHRTRG